MDGTSVLVCFEGWLGNGENSIGMDFQVTWDWFGVVVQRNSSYFDLLVSG